MLCAVDEKTIQGYTEDGAEAEEITAARAYIVGWE